MQPDDVNNFVQTRLGGFFVFVFVFLTYAVIMHKDGKSVQRENMRCTTEYVL